MKPLLPEESPIRLFPESVVTLPSKSGPEPPVKVL